MFFLPCSKLKVCSKQELNPLKLWGKKFDFDLKSRHTNAIAQIKTKKKIVNKKKEKKTSFRPTLSLKQNIKTTLDNRSWVPTP